jgi:hypothetical protein
MTGATNARRTASALSVLAAGVRQFSPAIERVSVQSLKPYPGNARRHSKAQIKQIAASIERFGFSNPVLVADDGEIVAGHGRVAAAKLLGIETVPAVRLSHLSEVERRAYVIADNKLALNAGWDRELLAIELQGLVDLDFEIELTGFSLAEVDIVLDEARESATDGADASIEDNIPAYRHEKPAVTQPGDLWILGRHKLICGDAREAGAYAALLGNEAVDLICTDPPYNVPNPDSGFRQLGLEIEAAQSRHSDIKDDTADNIRKFAFQHVRRRGKHLDMVTHRSKEAAECVTQAQVVVDNDDERTIG